MAACLEKKHPLKSCLYAGIHMPINNDVIQRDVIKIPDYFTHHLFSHFSMWTACIRKCGYKWPSSYLYKESGVLSLPISATTYSMGF